MTDQFSLVRAPKKYGSVHDLSAMIAGRLRLAQSRRGKHPIFVR